MIDSDGYCDYQNGCYMVHWIGGRENLQETMLFPIKYRLFLQDFPLNQSNNTWEIAVIMIDYDGYYNY